MDALIVTLSLLSFIFMINKTLFPKMDVGIISLLKEILRYILVFRDRIAYLSSGQIRTFDGTRKLSRF